MCERQNAIRYFLNKCSIKYNDPNINLMKFNCNDRGNENPNAQECSLCYNKFIPELEKYCCPDFSFYNWPSANIYSFEYTKNEIICASKIEPKFDKIGWYGNIYSPASGVIEKDTRPLLKKIGDDNSNLFDYCSRSTTI